MEATGKRAGGGWIGAKSLALAATLQALPGGALGMTWTPDHDREYVAAGRTGVPGLPIARAENHFQAREQVALFATRDSLYVQMLELACTIKVCDNVCLLQPRHTLAIKLPGTREAGPPVVDFARVWPVGAADRTASVAIARPGGRIHVLTFRLDTGIREVYRDSLRLEDPGGREVRGFAPDLDFFSEVVMSGFYVLGTGGLLAYVPILHDHTLGPRSMSVLPETVSSRVVNRGLLGTDDGRILAMTSDPPTPVIGPFGKAVMRLDGRTALLADGTWLFNHGNGWNGPHSVAGGAEGVLAVPSREGTIFRTYRDGVAKESPPADHPGLIVMPPYSFSYPGPPLDPDGAVKFAGGNLRFSVRLVDPDGNSPPPSFRYFGGDFFRPMDLGPKPLVPTNPGKGCEAPGLCMEGTDVNLALRLGEDSVWITLPVMDNAGYSPTCPNPGFAGRPAVLLAAMAWQRNSEAWVLFGQDTLVMRFGNRPPPLSVRRGAPAPAAGRPGPVAGSRIRWPSPRRLPVDASGRAAP